MLRLVKRKESPPLRLHDLGSGQVAEVLANQTRYWCMGDVVLRHGDDALVLDSGHSGRRCHAKQYSYYRDGNVVSDAGNPPVRLLEEGESLVVSC